MVELDRKKFVWDTLFVSLPSIFGLLSGFVIMIFITKSIGAIGYGIWSQFQTTFSLLSIFLCLSFGRAIPRFLAGEKDNQYLSKVFYSALTIILIVTMLFGAIFYLFKEPLADFLFGGRDLGIIVTLLLIFLLLRNLNRQGQHLIITRRYAKEWSIINLAIFTVTAVFVGLAAVLTKNIISTIVTFVAIDAVVLIFLICFIWGKGIKPTKPDFSSVKPLLKFGIPLIITGIGYWIIQSSDRYLIKYFLDISQVGIYSVSYSCAFVLMFFWTSLRGVLLPDLAVLYEQGKVRELEARFSRVLKYAVAFSVPAITGLFILASPIIKTLSSAEFLPASSVLVIVSVSVFFYGVFVHFNTLMDILKKVKFLSSVWITIAIINIILNLIFIPDFGITGAAYATLISFFIGALILILSSKKDFKISFKMSWAVKIITASIFMALIVNMINVTSTFSLVLTIILGAVAYGTTLFLLKFYDQSELSIFKKAV